MGFLRQLNLPGYQNLSRLGFDDLGIKTESIEDSCLIKREPIDDPMSPLTVLSDDSPLTSPRPSITDISTIPAIENLASSTGAVVSSRITSPQALDAMDARSPENESPSVPDDPGPLPLAIHTTPNESVLEAESDSLAGYRTPLQGCGVLELRPPGRPRRFSPPPTDNGKASTPPSVEPLALSGPYSSTQIKPDPSAEETICLDLMKAADDLNNWLVRPPIETKADSAGMSAPESNTQNSLPKLPLKRLPPIWAQVRMSTTLQNLRLNFLAVATGSMRIVRMVPQLSGRRVSEPWYRQGLFFERFFCTARCIPFVFYPGLLLLQA